MAEGLVINIPANRRHRIIKGSTDLIFTIEIEET